MGRGRGWSPPLDYDQLVTGEKGEVTFSPPRSMTSWSGEEVVPNYPLDLVKILQTGKAFPPGPPPSQDQLVTGECPLDLVKIDGSGGKLPPGEDQLVMVREGGIPPTTSSTWSFSLDWGGGTPPYHPLRRPVVHGGRVNVVSP